MSRPPGSNRCAMRLAVVVPALTTVDPMTAGISKSQAAVPPKLTALVPRKWLPVMTMVSPPAALPELGDRALIEGALAAV